MPVVRVFSGADSGTGDCCEAIIVTVIIAGIIAVIIITVIGALNISVTGSSSGILVATVEIITVRTGTILDINKSYFSF